MGREGWALSSALRANGPLGTSPQARHTLNHLLDNLQIKHGGDERLWLTCMCISICIYIYIYMSMCTYQFYQLCMYVHVLSSVGVEFGALSIRLTVYSNVRNFNLQDKNKAISILFFILDTMKIAFIVIVVIWGLILNIAYVSFHKSNIVTLIVKRKL